MKEFDVLSLSSSSMYFIVLAVYLIFILTNSIRSKKEKDIFNGLRIATLILPILYFAKLGYLNRNKKSMDVIQKVLLSIYFLFILIIICLEITEGEKKQYVYALVYVSPLLIVASLALCYQQWKSGNVPVYVIMMSLFLAMLYYTSFYDFLLQTSDIKTYDAILIIQTIISIVLSFIFGYMAYARLFNV